MALWGPLIGAGVTGLLGFMGANRQRADARRAGEPQPFSQETTRAPWGPTAGPLQDAIGINQQIFNQQRNTGPPPRISSSGIHGASPNMRALADAMRQRAMTSTFVPDAQARLTQFMQGPNPMMQQIFDRSQSYSNPMLDALSQRGFGGYYSTSQPQMQSFLSALMGGQNQLGGFPPAPQRPPAAMPQPPPQMMRPPATPQMPV